MEGAEAFFVKDPSEVEGETERPETYFEEYVTDPDLIKSKLSEGVFFKGVLKMNKKLKNRGYVTVPELECDILVNKFNYLNRA